MTKILPRAKRLQGQAAGEPAKLTKDIKDMIVLALEAAGGDTYLSTLAQTNPSVFCALLAKIIPTQVTGKDGGPIHVITGVPRN